MKNIIITGCSSGIGEAAVRYLTEHIACKLIGISRNENKLSQISNELKNLNCVGEFVPLPFDLSITNKYNVLYNKIQEHLSSVDILINNAGSLLNKSFEKINTNEFDHVMLTNFKAPFFLIKELLPLFSVSSHILNISSMGGFQGSIKFPGLSVYSASKAALANLTECLASELSDRKIYVNAIAPGAVETDMLKQAFPDFKAPVTASQMGEYISTFALHGHTFFNGKILPVSLSTP